MVNEYCPKCNELANMMVDTIERVEKDDKGKKFKVLTNSYHCNKCNLFVRSEDKRVAIEDEQ